MRRCPNCDTELKEVEVYDIETKETVGYSLTCPNSWRSGDCVEDVDLD